MKKLTSLVLSILLVGALAACENGGEPPKNGTNPGEQVNTTAPTTAAKEAFTVKEKAKIKLVDYSDPSGHFKMKIPEGFTVNVYPGDLIHYTIMVTDPKNPQYCILFNMKTEGYLYNESQRKWYASMYPNTPMAKLPALDPPTTEHFYEVFTQSFSLNNVETFTFPIMNGFEMIEKVGTSMTGGDVIRGTYTDDFGRKTDGLFSASMYPVNLYYVTAYYVYDTMFVTAPENEFIEWEGPLMECLGSIEFTQKFVDGFMGQEEIIGKSIKANAKIYSETSDLITKGWEARQSTYDIISQKQSDATLGYERVYDTQTNEIYRAYNGFTDDYSGDRYKAVTDNMYNLPVNGYIEKN
ncbi:MAG: hypothetical protein IK125_01770 [Lachnospiraceae bacterium]|nr:hypothetical protein [Lachnospiraceae bacterium]